MSYVFTDRRCTYQSIYHTYNHDHHIAVLCYSAAAKHKYEYQAMNPRFRLNSKIQLKMLLLVHLWLIIFKSKFFYKKLLKLHDQIMNAIYEVL